MRLKCRDVSRNSQPCRSDAAEQNGKRTAPPLAWPRWPVESGSGPSEAPTPYEHIGKVWTTQPIGFRLNENTWFIASC